jgi:hypothetical protein
VRKAGHAGNRRDKAWNGAKTIVSLAAEWLKANSNFPKEERKMLSEQSLRQLLIKQGARDMVTQQNLILLLLAFCVLSSKCPVLRNGMMMPPRSRNKVIYNKALFQVQ